MKTGIAGKITFSLLVMAAGSFLPLYGADVRSTPIDVHLIIDSSQALSGVKDEITEWVNQTLIDQALVEGDTITVWSAGPEAQVIFSGTIDEDTGKDGIKKSISELSASGDSADFSGALREAASKQGASEFSYTLLISASSAALSSVLSGPDASLMRFSRVEEFPGWRILVVGLNLEAKVQRAAAAFPGS